MNQVVHLKKLENNYGKRGLRIVAISNEPKGKIQEQMVSNRQVNYWMGSDPSGTTMSRYIDTSKGVGIPHAYLIDAQGKVVAEGFPNDPQIVGKLDELLRHTFDPALGRDLDSKLSSAQHSYERGDVGRAWTAAEKDLANADAKVAADAKFLRQKAESYAAFEKGLVQADVDARDYGTALDELKEAKRKFAGMDFATWAEGKLKELNSDKKVKEEMHAREYYDRAAKIERDANGSKRKLLRARSYYAQIIKQFPGTKAAELAQAALKRLGAA